jgi:hypothetical protein
MTAESKPSPLRTATHNLYEHFGCGRRMHPYIQSIGEASNTGTIHVFLVREPMGHEKPIPETWEGFPVESKVVGRITIGGPDV